MTRTLCYISKTKYMTLSPYAKTLVNQKHTPQKLIWNTHTHKPNAKIGRLADQITQNKVGRSVGGVGGDTCLVFL